MVAGRLENGSTMSSIPESPIPPLNKEDTSNRKIKALIIQGIFLD